MSHAISTRSTATSCVEPPRQDADDLTAEVFTTAWRRRDDLPRGAELPWLYKTAGFVLANHRRRAATLPLHALPPLTTPDHAEQAARSDELARALGRLSARDREVLMLHAWDGLDGNELATVLGVSRSGAQAALSRARARLRVVWAAADAPRTEMDAPRTERAAGDDTPLQDAGEA
ncbi:RNA polymerase sigma factor [Microbacterium invictum]|uniref:RNA polymerase sigma-70 factor (ECF subfamily) n=1 Tax=Microbacterium invictum TaxID=515415 RepID=A0AA40SPJ3_9MICO|nr:sigma-70 family RNA polymerase sigma factor [Microbacterium invictum]MBB4139976.1 RNA polymerase sigma-70 factor (ECF subfamily) [Microbacterium invictum]